MLENLAVRADGSVLVVASLQRQLWYVPAAPGGHLPVEPVLLHTFDEGQLAQSLVEAEPDLYYVFTYGQAVMHRLDLRGWAPGDPVAPTKVLGFEPPAGPNGSDLLAPGVMLVADCVEGLIRFSDTQQVPFPGINGLRYGPKTRQVYYATSSQNLFMRVAVDPVTLGPAGEPEHLGDVENVDDLVLDEIGGVAYIARHPDHKIERVPPEPGSPGPGQAVVAAGDPFTDHLIGPTSIHWGRAPGDYGRVAYVPTDGGVIKLPPDGELRPARLVRIEFPVEQSR